MRTLILLLAMVLLISFLVTNEAKAVTPLFIPAGVALGGAAPWTPILAGTVGPLIVFSPWIYQHIKYPECRKCANIGEQAECVQKLQKK